MMSQIIYLISSDIYKVSENFLWMLMMSVEDGPVLIHNYWLNTEQ